MFNKLFFFFENRAVYEIKWKNIVETGRQQATIWRMRITYWTPKSTNTPSGYVILMAFPLQELLHERVSVIRYTCSTVPVLFRMTTACALL
jgi:hypothetical protein